MIFLLLVLGASGVAAPPFPEPWALSAVGIEVVPLDPKEPHRHGSGVLVAGGVVTTRHLVEKAARIEARREAGAWPATVAHWDPEHDLVLLAVPKLPGAAAKIRTSDTLKTGEHVFMGGIPEGAPSSSETLITSLAPFGAVQLIQTGAPVDAGLTGGGLFDAKGLLVGVLSPESRDGQPLNLALPGEWVLALPKQPVVLPKAARRSRIEDEVAWYVQGCQSRARGDYDEAVRSFRKALKGTKDFVEAWTQLAFTYDSQRQYGDEIDALKEALRLKPDDWRMRTVLAAAYIHEGKHEEGIDAFKEALRVKPDSSETLLSLAFEYDSQRLYAPEAEVLETLGRLSPGDPVVFSQLGSARAHAGQYPQAIDAYRHALRLKPEDGLGWRRLGGAYAHEGQWTEAVKAFDKVVELNPSDADAWSNLGRACVGAGDRARALEVHKNLKTLDPSEAAAFYKENKKFLSP